jgi:phosphomevalonate kinase
MATLDSLKLALKQNAESKTNQNRHLSDTQYEAGLNAFVRNSGWGTYQDFIIPELTRLLTPLLNSRNRVSVLEVGPGPKSVLEHLPSHMRRKVGWYTAFEPNTLFATSLKNGLCDTAENEPAFPCLRTPPDIRRLPFLVQENSEEVVHIGKEKYDIVLFCHSMYGLKPKRKFIEEALRLLVDEVEGGIVAVFHRNESLNFDGLVCHRTASFPTGVIQVPGDDEALDHFAPFVAGFVTDDEDVRASWRETCRTLGSRKENHPGYIFFSSPEIMVAFNHHAAALPELLTRVPTITKAVKNREALLHRPASIVRPRDIRQLQECVEWALKHETALSMVSGGHSGHCLVPNVVAVDMGAFDQIHVLDEAEGEDRFIVAETGCNTGDIIRKTMTAGLTVPLGSRPDVGAGLWLQGGIGHLARQYGLTSDNIVGAVIVSVDSGQVLCIGFTPSQYQPMDAIRPDNDFELLWALRGAGTNFGIVVSVTLEAYAAPSYLVRNWILPLKDEQVVLDKLGRFDDALLTDASSQHASVDAYLYSEAGQLHMGVTTYEINTIEPSGTSKHSTWGLANDTKTVDGVGLFDTEMYMSGMHGGHSGGKTSSFKRCLFLKNIGSMAQNLVEAISTRPSHLCYLHLLQGGGATRRVVAESTAFGCRGWEHACVITGVWPRDQDGSEIARATIQWVYDVAEKLLPFSDGVYGADLGPDPRDVILAAKAFGPNSLRLSRLKKRMDPHNLLAYACPLPRAPMEPKLIILVTGDYGAGKDYSASTWVSLLSKTVTARAVSISDAIKCEYAAKTGADLKQLLGNRACKEQHRLALTAFYQEQTQKRPELPKQHFLNVIYSAANVDVLLITGMRDESPVATFSHLVPDSKVIEIQVVATEDVRSFRRGKTDTESAPDSFAPDHRPCLTFTNNSSGPQEAEFFAKHQILRLLHTDLTCLANMVRSIPSFPLPGIDFQYILGIAEQPGGLPLCTSLLQLLFSGPHTTDAWENVDAVVSCEMGGFIFASALALRVDLPMVLIREAGKLPPPMVSVSKPMSHVRSVKPGGGVQDGALVTSLGSKEKVKRIEMDRDVLRRGAKVVVVDDVLATGETLCAVLELLKAAGVGAADISVMIVAEFPVHCGRQLLRQRGFREVKVQSLLVFGGA